MSESRVTWSTSVSILVILVLSVLELVPMYATDVGQTDVRQKHRLMPPHYGGGGIINDVILAVSINLDRNSALVISLLLHYHWALTAGWARWGVVAGVCVQVCGSRSSQTTHQATYRAGTATGFRRLAAGCSLISTHSTLSSSWYADEQCGFAQAFPEGRGV